MRLMITRPEEDARPLADALAERGIEAVIEPLLSVRVQRDAALDLDGAQGLLITSANGARAVAQLSARRDLAVYAVGDASARAARDAGFGDVKSAGGDVDDLARLVAREADPGAGALVHVAGSKVAGDLAGLLQADGFLYRRAVLYDAVTATALSETGRRALGDGAVDGVLFFSPRTAETFVALVRAAGLAPAVGGLTAYCLSDQVAKKASALSWARVVVAQRPEQAALLAAIETP